MKIYSEETMKTNLFDEDDLSQIHDSFNIIMKELTVVKSILKKHGININYDNDFIRLMKPFLSK